MAATDLDARFAEGLRDPRLLAAGLALSQNRLRDAEPVLKACLRDNPFDVLAMRMLAELAVRIGRVGDAETLLRRALALAPGFAVARVNLAMVLYQTNRAAAALDELGRLTSGEEDDNPNLRAAVLGRLGHFDQALSLYEAVLAHQPEAARVWMSYGHVLKTVGRTDDGVAAYRRAVAIEPSFGEAWWSLANLKIVRFDAGDIATMAAALAAPELSADDRFHLEFALGKAHEDRGEVKAAFARYADANAHRRALIDYDAGRTHARVTRAIERFDAAFFAAREGWGCPSLAPIFVVGLPRSGSTLIEQILASHSAVEAITELPDIPELWGGLGDDPIAAVDALGPDAVRRLGEDYLARIAPQRQTARRHFIDKLPNNWLHVGFVRLILPNARIVDARRHPLSCGFSNFRQHFARGQHFSYDLADIGRYYADYVALLGHFDRVLPGVVHRVVHDTMVDDSETTIRALLAGLGLPFESACLDFHRTERAVRTPSAQQVRVPIFRDGVDAWRKFDDWLGPLRDALGPVLENWDGTAKR